MYRGRTLIEVKCPLDALPLGGDGGEDSRAPNARLLAAAHAAAAGRGDALARYPRARRADYYSRASRHVAALADHLAAERGRARLAAVKAARATRAAGAGRMLRPGRSTDGPGDPDATPSPDRARALLLMCFQFDAPPVRAVRPPARKARSGPCPDGWDGREAVLGAVASAVRGGVEMWQVNLKLDAGGVSLGACFPLDLFGDGRAQGRGQPRAAAAREAAAAAAAKAAESGDDDSDDDRAAAAAG